MTAFQNLRNEIPASEIDPHHATYAKAVDEIRSLLTVTDAYVRPTESRQTTPFVQKAFPEIRRDKFESGVIHSKSEFADRACNRPSPFHTADSEACEKLDKDLMVAIEYISRRGSRIIRDRADRIRVIKKISASLEPMRAMLDFHKSQTAKDIALPFNVAFTAAVIDAMQWPDVMLPVLYLKGFPVIGDIADSYVFRFDDDQHAETSMREFMSMNTIMVKSITQRLEKQAARKDPESVQRGVRLAGNAQKKKSLKAS